MAATKQSARRYPKATPICKPAAGNDDPAALIEESADNEGGAPATMTAIGRRALGAIAGDPVDDDDDDDDDEDDEEEADDDDGEDDDEDDDDEVDDTPDQYPDEGNPDDEDDPTAIGRNISRLRKRESKWASFKGQSGNRAAAWNAQTIAMGYISHPRECPDLRRQTRWLR